MPIRGAQAEWTRLIAAVAVRSRLTPNQIREMYWCDFREFCRALGIKVPKTGDELNAEIQRFIHAQNNRNGHSRS